MISFNFRNRKYLNIVNEIGIRRRRQSVKRFTPTAIFDFSNYIISMWMLVVALRVGSLLFFVFTDVIEIELYSAVKNIELPVSGSMDHVVNKRLQIYLTISSEGEYKLNGEYDYQLDELLPELQNMKKVLPNVQVTLIIDKNCKMRDVVNATDKIREAEIYKIFFLTKKSLNIRPV